MELHKLSWLISNILKIVSKFALGYVCMFVLMFIPELITLQSMIEDEPFILASMVILLGVMNWEKEIRKRHNINWKVRWICWTWTRLLSHSVLVGQCIRFLSHLCLSGDWTYTHWKRAGRWLTKVNKTGLKAWELPLTTLWLPLQPRSAWNKRAFLCVFWLKYCPASDYYVITQLRIVCVN